MYGELVITPATHGNAVFNPGYEPRISPFEVYDERGYYTTDALNAVSIPKRCVYLAGSLRNPAIPLLGERIRKAGLDVFDDWQAVGPDADDYWMAYERGRGRTYPEALKGAAAIQVFDFDCRNLDRCSDMVLVLPCGKSGHMELGYMAGKGKRAYVLFDKEPERWDVMYQFASGGVFFDADALLKALTA